MNRAWDEILTGALREMVQKVATFLPDVVGVVVLLVMGFIVSKLIQRVTVLLLRKIGFDRALDRAGIHDLLHRVNIRTTPSAFVGRLTFWLFMLTFLLSAADAVGLQSVSATINSFVEYVPNVIGATVIVVVGLLLAHLIRDVVRGSTAGIGLDYANSIGTLVYGIVVVIVVSLAITQLRIEAALINQVILVLLVTGGAALAITLGWGTRDVVRNLIAGIYARERFEPGSRVRFGEYAGRLQEVGNVNTVLATDDGERIYIPNGQLLDAVVRSTPAAPRTTS